MMTTLETIGTIEDEGLIGASYFDVYCSFCDKEVYNVPICIASLCPHCGSVVIACPSCIDEYDCETERQLRRRYVSMLVN
jgi:hypothetical protein